MAGLSEHCSADEVEPVSIVLISTEKAKTVNLFRQVHTFAGLTLGKHH